MKRVIITPHDPDRFLGGTERVVQAIVRSRIQRGEEIVMFAGSERFAPVTTVEQRGDDNLAIHQVLRARQETGEVFLRPTVRGEFERLISAIEPDVVEWHHGATLSMDLVRAAKEHRVKTIVYLHDLWLSCPRYFRIPPAGIVCPAGQSREACVPCVKLDLPWAESKLQDWVQSFAANAAAELAAADVKVAPSRVHAERIQGYFPGAPLDIHVVPHGLLHSGLTRPTAAPRVRDGVLRLVHFGNLVREKGLDDLAAALAKLSEPNRVSLDLHGEELTPGIVSGMRALAPNVKITSHGGYRSCDEIFDRVAVADLAVFPSRAPESYGLVVDEAFAAGVPVLVSNRGALPERIGDAGLALPAEDPESWYCAIQRILEHPHELDALRSKVPLTSRTIENAIDEVDAL